jgi:hypothetical protein
MYHCPYPSCLKPRTFQCVGSVFCDIRFLIALQSNLFGWTVQAEASLTNESCCEKRRKLYKQTSVIRLTNGGRNYICNVTLYLF